MTRLTVCITTYNRWSDCRHAVESVVGQIGVDIQVILVDDCSDEAAPTEFATLVEQQGVRYIRHERNQGLAAARNTAIQLATGEWFSFCDDDDQWPPDFAARLLDALVSAPLETQMVIGLSEEKKNRCEALFSCCPTMRELLLAGMTPPVAAQMYRTSMLKKLGGYDTAVHSGVDHDLWITLAATDNPRTTVAWGNTPVVGVGTEQDRMTTDEDRRRVGIKNAMAIWKPKLVSSLGVGFFKHFRRAYSEYLDRKFFLQDLRYGRYAGAIARALNPSVAGWLVRRTLLGPFKKQTCGLFPPYAKHVEQRES